MVDAITRFPGISRAALEIALDNGGINRFRPPKQQQRELSKFLERQPQEILPAIDAWLASLSDDDLSTACCGEHSEMEAILLTAPPFTDQLLSDYFDEVC
jgi:hypothetical protein